MLICNESFSRRVRFAFDTSLYVGHLLITRRRSVIVYINVTALFIYRFETSTYCL